MINFNEKFVNFIEIVMQLFIAKQSVIKKYTIKMSFLNYIRSITNY